MKGKYLPLLTKKNNEYGYELAYRLAGEQLAKIKDVERQCGKSGTQCQLTASRKELALKYLNQSYRVSLPDIEISLEPEGGAIPIRDKILILHYLTMAKGTPLTNTAITYKELPEGIHYFPTFYKRAIKPLASHFGNNPQQLLEIAKTLGGQQADYGDLAVTINAFSQVPITLVLWKGDEELAPEGNIIFDSNISDYLPTEDITVLSETIAWRLVKAATAGGDNPGRN